MQDLIWFAFIAACALAGVALTLLWIRVRGRTRPLEDLDDIERALQRRGVPPSRRGRTQRPPPPTPDLISIQEAWQAADRPHPETGVIFEGLGQQESGTPTAPSGPRQGWQRGAPPTARPGEPSAAAEASDEATVMGARALSPSELEEPAMAEGDEEPTHGDGS